MSRLPASGQTMNPKPNIAPTSPKFLARSWCVSEISFMIAFKTPMFPHVIPFTNLVRKNNTMLCESINTKKDNAVPHTHKARMLFLPYLSDSCPRIGAAKKAKKE